MTATARPTSSRSRWRLWGLIALAAVAVGAVAVVVALRIMDEDPFASPGTVELPPLPDDAAPTAVYLAGPEGVRLGRFMDALDPVLTDDPSVSDCEVVIAALDAIGTPDQIFAAAAAVPDPVTSDMAVNHLDAGSRFLGRCLEDGSVPDRDELRFTAIVLERRLEQLQ